MQQFEHIKKSLRTLRLNSVLMALIAIVGLALVACDMPQGNDSSAEEGTLRINIDSGDGTRSLTLLPDTDMVPSQYRITGDGPNGDSFETTTVGGTTEVPNLRVGDWTVEVFAKNAQAQEIGYGQSAVAITAAATTAVEIAVRPLSGTGELSLTVEWPAAEVSEPAVAATLTRVGGDSQSLAFTIGAAGSAGFTGQAIDAGYYTLSLTLLDGDTVVAGAVETVRIVHGGHTSGSFSFQELNHATGEVDMVVTVDSSAPLEVRIDDASEVLAFGATMDVSAVVTNASAAELTYEWYVNGTHTGAGPSLQFGADLARGNYRLDVVVFTDDGLRFGSAGHQFRVE